MSKSTSRSAKRKAPKRKAPWKKPAPKGSRARPYPNLVNDMRVAGER